MSSISEASPTFAWFSNSLGQISEFTSKRPLSLSSTASTASSDHRSSIFYKSSANPCHRAQALKFSMRYHRGEVPIDNEPPHPLITLLAWIIVVLHQVLRFFPQAPPPKLKPFLLKPRTPARTASPCNGSLLTRLVSWLFSLLFAPKQRPAPPKSLVLTTRHRDRKYL